MAGPSKKWKGYWIPAELALLFERDHLINMPELFLLAMIDSLCDVETDEPCFASNEYFIRHMSISKVHLCRMLQHLESLGLIIRSMNGRKRSLQIVGGLKKETQRSQKGDPPSDLTYIHYKKGDNRRSVDRLNPSKESKVPFIATTEKHNEKITPFDVDCATRLQIKVNELWPLAVKWKIANQAKYIAMLRKQVGKAAVETVIEWYCDTATKNMKPRLTNCKQLRERWDDWDLSGKAFKAQDAKIKIDVHTKRIVQSMGMTAGLAVKDLERVTQLTANRMQQFWDCVIKIAGESPLKKSVREQTNEEKARERMKRLAMFFVNGGFPNRWHFTSQWLSDLIRKIDYLQHQNGNSGWKGDLMDQALQLHSKEFHEYGRSLTAKFSGSDSRAWDAILDILQGDQK